MWLAHSSRRSNHDNINTPTHSSQIHIAGSHTRYTKLEQQQRQYCVAHTCTYHWNVFPLFDLRRPRDIKSTPSRRGTLYLRRSCKPTYVEVLGLGLYLMAVYPKFLFVLPEPHAVHPKKPCFHTFCILPESVYALCMYRPHAVHPKNYFFNTVSYVLICMPCICRRKLLCLLPRIGK